MDALATEDVFLFHGFRLDRRGGGLFRRDESGVFVPMAMGSRALDILGVLVEQPGKLISSGYPFRYRELRGSLQHLLTS